MLDFNKRCAVAEFAHFSREFAFASAVGVDATSPMKSPALRQLGQGRKILGCCEGCKYERRFFRNRQFGSVNAD